jgi:hypothetical protein
VAFKIIKPSTRTDNEAKIALITYVAFV